MGPPFTSHQKAPERPGLLWDFEEDGHHDQCQGGNGTWLAEPTPLLLPSGADDLPAGSSRPEEEGSKHSHGHLLCYPHAHTGPFTASLLTGEQTRHRGWPGSPSCAHWAASRSANAWGREPRPTVHTCAGALTPG